MAEERMIAKCRIGTPLDPQVSEMYRRTEAIDSFDQAHSGTSGCPGGPATGVLTLRLDGETAVTGVAFDVYTKDHAERQRSIEKFAGACGA